MTRLLKTLSAILMVAAFVKCSPKLSAGDSSSRDADSLVAYLERTPCFGKCPYYSIHVYRSGYAVYEGKRDVEKLGRYFTWISQREVESIGEKAEELGFFNLNDEYKNPRLTDFPTVYVEVRYKGKIKKVTHYDTRPPAALKGMEDFIDAVFNERQWVLHPDQGTRD